MTLKGFKSFASTTHLNFEPGITCVVGPNGSGKSNVIDALSWVMGEQGAKTLRGGKMEDVIFAGTSGRAPLGRAEVELTIDNTDGALPIDYTEVTISRILFRNGQSEYQINGQASRLLDIQELLSDSGIGREMHVIVGQGQLNDILLTTPEDRRSYIEEAAGVLKHRKRKEKALRKLDAMQVNFARIQDLTVELRRQLKPLGKQAEVAKKAAFIQSDVRDARLRILADDIISARSAIDADLADESSLRSRKETVEKELADIRAREEELDQISLRENPELSQVQDIYYRLSSLREKFRSLQSLASDRAKYLSQDLEEARASGRDPESLEQEATALTAEKSQLEQDLQTAIAAREVISKELAALEEELHLEESRVSTQLRALADQREGTARHEGHIKSLNSKIEATTAEITRLEAAREDAKARNEKFRQDANVLEVQIASQSALEPDLDSNFEKAKNALATAKSNLEKINQDLNQVSNQAAGVKGRLTALQENFPVQNGNEKLKAQSNFSILGQVSELLEIEPGWEKAVARALGDLSGAVLTTSLNTAFEAITFLKQEGAGNSEIFILDNTQVNPRSGMLNHNRMVEKVSSPKNSNLAAALLSNFYYASDIAEAKSIIEADAQAIVITKDGDFCSERRISGGSSQVRSILEIRAMVEQLSNEGTQLENQSNQLKFEKSQKEDALRQAESEYELILAKLNESDAQISALSEQISAANQNAKNALAEFERLGVSLNQAQSQRERDLQELEISQNNYSAPAALVEPDTSMQDDLRESVNLKRQNQVETHLNVRSLEEKINALTNQISALYKAAETERNNAAAFIERRKVRGEAVVTSTNIANTAYEVLIKLEASINSASARREELQRTRVEREGEILAFRSRSRELSVELERLTSSVHQDEMARTEQRMRIESMELRAIEELGVDIETLVNEYGPQNDVPTMVEKEDGEFVPGELIPYRRDQQEKRLARAEKDLAMLGKINPLALEEFTALQDRLSFLAEELEDLKKAKADLLEIIKEVDQKVETIFKDAYLDVEREFKGIFARLFPGGDGQLVLTDPDNWTTTGIEIEARPPGKRLKRLSLLSGGEKSLAAVAFLVAIFKARPSPFYVMDEVEAALDDTNLGRLLEIFEELRDKSQLIVITHQKRTMEVADALYGVTMKKDGVSEVISQRLRDNQAS
jgi:chromosome segregation protein